VSLIKPISGADDRVPLAQALPLRSPFTLNVFPTNACNFKCSYCAHSLHTDVLEKTYGLDKQYMSVDTMALVIEQSKSFEPYKLLSFMGHGEPLLCRDLPKMAAMAAEAGIAQRIEIITNASLLTHTCSDALIDAGITNLRVSLQGLDADAYRKTSGAALDFKEFMEQLSYFYRKKKPGMGLFVKILDVSLSAGNEEVFYKMFDAISDRMYIERVQPVYHAVSVSGGSRTECHDRYGNTHPPRKVCPLTFFSLAVWPNGEVQPCDAIYRPCLLGNVKETTLPEMWQGETLRQFRLQHLSGGKEKLAGCTVCCAPDDVSHPLDVLDDQAEALAERFLAKLL